MPQRIFMFLDVICEAKIFKNPLWQEFDYYYCYSSLWQKLTNLTHTHIYITFDQPIKIIINHMICSYNVLSSYILQSGFFPNLEIPNTAMINVNLHYIKIWLAEIPPFSPFLFSKTHIIWKNLTVYRRSPGCVFP